MNLTSRPHSTKVEVVDVASVPSSVSIQDSTTAMYVDDETLTQKTMYNYMNKAMISENMRMCIELLLLFHMFICCTLPWSLLDSSFFFRLHTWLKPCISPPRLLFILSETSCTGSFCMGGKFKGFISNYSHLTLSFNGWSTHKNDEIYTFHITTPKHCSFFMDGHVFKGLLVTGEDLCDVLVWAS